MKIKPIINCCLMAAKRKLYNPARKNAIMVLLRKLALKYPKWGYRKMQVLLNQAGHAIGKHKTRELMTKLGLIIKQKVKSGRSNSPISVRPNLTKHLKASRKDEVWFADITCIKTKCGRDVYVALVMDGYSRRIIGRAESYRQDVHLVLKAFRMAMRRRMPRPGVIHHSDQGSQYTSAAYIRELKRNGFQVSFSKKGFPYDNGIMERLMNTLKHEEVYLWEYATIKDVRNGIRRFIAVYNNNRPHAALGYITPCQYEVLFTASFSGSVIP